jgi:hypothetical protein
MDQEQRERETGWAPFDFVNRAQRVALKLLTPAVISAMEASWGSSWLDKLNALIAEADTRLIAKKGQWTRRKPFAIENGTIPWELSQLCYAIADVAEYLPAFKTDAGELRRLALRVVDIRNGQSHYKATLNANDLRRAEGDLDRLIRLVDVIAGQTVANDIRRIREEMTSWAVRSVEAPTTGESQAVGDLAEIKKLLVELLAVKDVAAEPRNMPDADTGYSESQGTEVTKKNDSELQSKGSQPPKDSNQGEPSRPHPVRSPLPPPRPGMALFPAVSEQNETASELCYVVCDRLSVTDPSVLFRPLGLDTTQRNLCHTIIETVRAREANHDLSILSVRARFEPTEFEGPSFGLATVIADRSVRYGLAPEYNNRYIIATGEVAKNGRGQIGEIDSFAAKVRLMVRCAPAGSLFVFPLANLEKADASTRDALNQAKVSGGFAWRTVEHVDDLDDIFARPATLPTARATNLWAFTRLPSLFLKSAVGGLLLFAGIYGLSELHSAFRVDPVVEEAARKDIEEFRRLAAQIPLVPDNAGACRTLQNSAQGVTDAQKHLSPDSLHVELGTVERCAKAFADSDRRWAALASADQANGNSGSGLTAVSVARSNLTAFDLSRSDEGGKSSLLSRTGEVAVAIAASDRRLKALDDAAARVLRTPAYESDATLVAVANELTELDRGRLSATQLGYVSLSGDANARLTTSDLRLSGLVSAYDDLRNDNTEPTRRAFHLALKSIDDYDRARIRDGNLSKTAAATQDGLKLAQQGRITDLKRAIGEFQIQPSDAVYRKMTAAVQTLEPEDLAAMTAEERTLLDQVREGGLMIAKSDLRLQSLLVADRELERVRSQKVGALAAAEALILASMQLTDFDRSRLNAEHRLALSSAEKVKAEVEAGKARNAELLRAAEVLLMMGDKPTEDMRNNLTRAYRALTGLDFEQLTSDQISLVNRACNIRKGQSGASLQAIGGCIGPSIRFGPPVLKPSISLQ